MKRSMKRKSHDLQTLFATHFHAEKTAETSAYGFAVVLSLAASLKNAIDSVCEILIRHEQQLAIERSRSDTLIVQVTELSIHTNKTE